MGLPLERKMFLSLAFFFIFKEALSNLIKECKYELNKLIWLGGYRCSVLDMCCFSFKLEVQCMYLNLGVAGIMCCMFAYKYSVIATAIYVQLNQVGNNDILFEQCWEGKDEI